MAAAEPTPRDTLLRITSAFQVSQALLDELGAPSAQRQNRQAGLPGAARDNDLGVPGGPPDGEAIFNAPMMALSAGVAGAVVRCYGFSGIGLLVDVGGGEPDPARRPVPSAPRRRYRGGLLERAGVADRCEVVGGNFFEGAPGGAECLSSKERRSRLG